MADHLSREYVEQAAVETTEALLRTNILKPGERIELAGRGGTVDPLRLTVFSEPGNERTTMLDDCSLRRVLDGVKTLRALAYFAEFRIE